jgi:hypothetical protein
MFNGDDIAGVVDAADLAIVFRPAEPIENITTLQIQVGGGQYASTSFDVCINGSDTVVATINNANANLNSNPALPVSIPIAGGTLTSLALYETSGSGDVAGWAKLIVNGQVYLDGVNNSYGPNGFHLDFSDPDNLGKDVANGNDFTATGFDTQSPGIWSNYLWTAGTGNDPVAVPNEKNFPSSSPASYAFNGAGNAAEVSSTNEWMSWIPTTPITCNASVLIKSLRTGDGEARLTVDGVTYQPTLLANNNWRWEVPGTIERIDLRNTVNPEGLYWVQIDGVELIDNTGTDYDLMQDSPTQNYATGNPLMHGIDGGTRIMTYADGNLTFAGAGPSSLPWTHPTIRVPMGVRAYAEFTNTFGAITSMVGVSERRPTGDGDWGSPGTWSWGLDSRVWVKDPSGTTDTVNVPGRWTGTAGSVAGVEVNTTVTPPTVTFTLNGTNPQTFTFNADFDPDNIWIGGNFSANEVVQNFGQRPFVHRPAGLTDANDLQTQNLPAATIANGRDHFQAITDTGANILTAAQTAFPNGLWWIKDRVNSNQHQFVDSVTNASQGGGNWANTSPTISQAIAYAAPAGNSVAWCWNAAEPATSGFNIVQYTGQNPTTTTVPHGLPGIPDMIITQAKTGTTRNYAVFHSALGEGQWLQLNGSDQALADATMWANTAPDETNFFVGAANTTNFSGAVYTAYCWTAIPGHSAFGSFQGNSDTNGVFVYLGFSPQMLMIRTTGAGDSFFMLDSTRSPNNPIGVDGLLNAGSTDPEGTWSARDIDFLSNGFKLRSSSGSVNGGTVVYAAWAENPFGSSNTSPANAR